MLYLKEYITESTCIGIWKMDESVEELLSAISHAEWIQNIYSIKSETRIKEVLSARLLIKELAGEEKEVYYNDSGKPFLADRSYHISVSHTKGYVAVAFNAEKEIGLDIELISEKIRRVKSRLISASEYIDENNDLIHLLLHWSAKEAMFKFIDVSGVNFLDHLFVGAFTPEQEGAFRASERRTNAKHEFHAFYRVEKDFVLVCLEADD
ncbi:4'-phosphopantetheinyl transferase superfamily protein [Dysgonomonas sp. BGC7]|uniref:4'-phosphopantetheinyl transferase superfamily protein n=1 Tax=Dysgonomonas sp. BGC7 TaxID=1658008 RepID=UPI0006809836|nr:4'-phosphopantetheinyl transferase superfamily protein [Dysgonomonas sp. BGC7]MBD8388156.1 hypothetical protein [Dysgonomonas sp. BGC7]